MMMNMNPHALRGLLPFAPAATNAQERPAPDQADDILARARQARAARRAQAKKADPRAQEDALYRAIYPQ